MLNEETLGLVKDVIAASSPKPVRQFLEYIPKPDDAITQLQTWVNLYQNKIDTEEAESALFDILSPYETKTKFQQLDWVCQLLFLKFSAPTPNGLSKKSPSNLSSTYFGSNLIPNDVIIHIFSFLTLRELLTVAHIKLFRDAALSIVFNRRNNIASFYQKKLFLSWFSPHARFSSTFTSNSENLKKFAPSSQEDFLTLMKNTESDLIHRFLYILARMGTKDSFSEQEKTQIHLLFKSLSTLPYSKDTQQILFFLSSLFTEEEKRKMILELKEILFPRSISFFSAALTAFKQSDALLDNKLNVLWKLVACCHILSHIDKQSIIQQAKKIERTYYKKNNMSRQLECFEILLSPQLSPMLSVTEIGDILDSLIQILQKDEANQFKIIKMIKQFIFTHAKIFARVDSSNLEKKLDPLLNHKKIYPYQQIRCDILGYLAPHLNNPKIVIDIFFDILTSKEKAGTISAYQALCSLFGKLSFSQQACLIKKILDLRSTNKEIFLFLEKILLNLPVAPPMYIALICERLQHPSPSYRINACKILVIMAKKLQEIPADISFNALISLLSHSSKEISQTAHETLKAIFPKLSVSQKEELKVILFSSLDPLNKKKFEEKLYLWKNIPLDIIKDYREEITRKIEENLNCQDPNVVAINRCILSYIDLKLSDTVYYQLASVVSNCNENEIKFFAYNRLTELLYSEKNIPIDFLSGVAIPFLTVIFGNPHHPLYPLRLNMLHAVLLADASYFRNFSYDHFKNALTEQNDGIKKLAFEILSHCYSQLQDNEKEDFIAFLKSQIVINPSNSESYHSQLYSCVALRQIVLNTENLPDDFPITEIIALLNGHNRFAQALANENRPIRAAASDILCALAGKKWLEGIAWPTPEKPSREFIFTKFLCETAKPLNENVASAKKSEDTSSERRATTLPPPGNDIELTEIPRPSLRGRPG